MKRRIIADLERWDRLPAPKPLVLRGARQVGKSYVVRDFARLHKSSCVELNFERNPDASTLFATNDPRATLRAVEAFTNQPVRPPHTLLFLDEIQAAPEVLAKLRWFAEEVPELRVIAAGSLLDFVLREHSFSMPVGRITYLHLEPMSFGEFLEALGEGSLADLLATATLQTSIPPAIHVRLLALYREYILVGGMPAAVERYSKERSLLSCSQVHQDLLATYRDDFAKYANRVHHHRLTRVLQAVPRQLGQKFTYSRADPAERAAALRQALDMLAMARLCHRVRSTHATGLPLCADASDRYYKVILLDVGLVSAALGLSLRDIQDAHELTLVNSGALAEQAVGQALRLIEPPFRDPELFYWARTEAGAEAEVDYVIQVDSSIIPIEVKAGATGTLKSLHMLMAKRNFKRAVRFNSAAPSRTKVSAAVRDGSHADYELVSLPLYWASEASRLLQSG